MNHCGPYSTTHNHSYNVVVRELIAIRPYFSFVWVFSHHKLLTYPSIALHGVWYEEDWTILTLRDLGFISSDDEEDLKKIKIFTLVCLIFFFSRCN